MTEGEIILKRRVDRLEETLRSLLTDFILNGKIPESVKLAGQDALIILNKPLGNGYSPMDLTNG